MNDTTLVVLHEARPDFRVSYKRQPMPRCKSCNGMKGTRLVEEWRQDHDCKCNVLDSPDGDGRFWHELSWDEEPEHLARRERYTRGNDHWQNRMWAMHAYDCRDL